MSRLRILLLAPDANPESISVALVSYRHAEALAQIHSITLVGRSSNEATLRANQAKFEEVEIISMPWLDRLFAWCLRWIFRNNFHSHALTAFMYPFSIAFEWHTWRRLRSRIVAGEFDAVLRLSPVTSVIPSIFPSLLRRTSVPFIIGPINGGLPWPEGFSQSQKQKGWFDNLRKLYRFMPFARSTYKRAAAIIAGASQIYKQFPEYRHKLFFVPENGVDTLLCGADPRSQDPSRKLDLIFVGALIPCKACDLALRAVAPLVREGLVRFTIVGDGPERGRLEQLTVRLGIEKEVSFLGMVPHHEAMRHLRTADVMVFPSVRDFGGGVVFEALAVGAVPIVADFGGPGDTVRPDIGFKVALTDEDDVVAQIEKILRELVRDRSILQRYRERGMSYARENLTWEAKARTTTRILDWVVRQGLKPDLDPPKKLASDKGFAQQIRVRASGAQS